MNPTPNLQSYESRSSLVDLWVSSGLVFWKDTETWQTGVVNSIHKKGDRCECIKYRGISLLGMHFGQAPWKKIARKLNQNWRIPSGVFFPAVALQSKFSLSSKLRRNLGRTGISKTSTHVLSTSRKHTTGFVVKSYWECRGRTVLTAACYWPSSHCILAQKFVCCIGLWQGCVLSLLFFIFYMNWIDSHSRFDKGAMHCWNLQDQPFTFSRRCCSAGIFTQQGLQHALHRFSAACDQMGMKASTKDTTRYYVSPETQGNVPCK